MKYLALGIILVIGLSAIGWISFDFSGDDPSVELKTEAIEQDTEVALDTGKRVLHETGEVLQEIGED